MKTALIVHGGWDGHQPVQVSELFEDVLKKEGYAVDRFDTLDAFSDAQKLSTYDLIVPIWTMGQIDEKLVNNVSQAVVAGTGLAGCHGGMCDSFRNSTHWQFMTGAQWVAHPGNDGVEYKVELKQSAASPIIDGLADFTVKSEQYYIHIDPAVNVLATTRFPIVDGPHATNGVVDMPVVFTKRWGKGRVFYNSLGHQANIFDIPEALELMRRGFVWASR